jgi:hypothetical protein
MTMTRAQWITVTMAGIGVLLCTHVQAQQMYRCGKVFQDRPCDGNQQINTPAASSSTAQNAARPATNQECVRRGEEAQKIVWAKEAGRTEEMQLAAASPAQKQLISDVYRRRGTSTEMRAAIEADCNAEKERAAQAAALISAGNKMLEPNRSAAPSSAGGSGDAGQSATAVPTPTRESLAAAEAKKQDRCKSLNSQLTRIREQQRRGTSAANMDRLNSEYAETDRTRRDEGC